MFHHCGQRHPEWRGEFAHGKIGSGRKPHHQSPPGRVRQRGEGAVEGLLLKLNHMV